jgi:hypothetical protein
MGVPAALASTQPEMRGLAVPGGADPMALQGGHGGFG